VHFPMFLSIALLILYEVLSGFELFARHADVGSEVLATCSPSHLTHDFDAFTRMSGIGRACAEIHTDSHLGGPLHNR
jgi:hypothetical protein